MNNVTSIKDIAELGKGEYFLEVNNRVGQRWYFPYKNIGKYRSMFRPSSFAGKIIYHTLPLIKHVSFILPRLNMKRVRMRLKENILAEITKSFNCKDLTFAVFCGSPGKHQKLTLMIRQKEKIAGYCKISDNPNVIEMFKKERDALLYLNERNISMAPKVLMCSKIPNTNNIWLYIQSTEQEDSITYPTIHSKEIFDYIQDIQRKCAFTARYCDTTFHNDICKLKELYPLYFDSNSCAILRQCIKETETELERKETLYAFAHGDFTPWNCFCTNKGLFAFDFEYCRMSYPLFYDIFHFYTQSCIYDKYWDCEMIYKEYKAYKSKVLIKYIEPQKCDFYYKCYLLGIIGFYLSRDNGILNKRLEECFGIWISLINKILKE